MTFIIALLYIVLTYLSPASLFPALASYRILLWLAGLALLGILGSAVTGSFPFRPPQFRLMLGFIAAIALSRLAHLTIGGAISSLSDFMTSGIAFFAILAGVKTLSRARTVLFAMALVGLALLTRSVIALYSGGDQELYVLKQVVAYDPATGAPSELQDRIRSVGFLADPNDFAQFLLVTVPFIFLLWEHGRHLRNVLLVIAPSAFVVYGIILTHSRGALIGLVALVVFSFGGRLGKVGRVVLIVVGLCLVVALNRGQREVSANEGSAAGRLEAWGTGISMLKSEPLFGTGFGTFTQFNSLTAHNSFVLCFAELGLFGYFFWLGLIVSTSMQLNAAAEPESGLDPALIQACHAVRVSLFTFLTTSWFLSRTYVVTLYILIGLAVSLIALVSEDPREDDAGYPSMSWPRTTVILEFVSIAFVYGFVRLRGL